MRLSDFIAPAVPQYANRLVEHAQQFAAQVPRQVLYDYFLDWRLGLTHVRIPTWLSFTVQVYANGHDDLARQLSQRKIGFVQLDDPAKAQKLADKFAHSPGRRFWRSLPRSCIRCGPRSCLSRVTIG